jgi:DNA-binding response OmpR family regulator
MSAKVLYIDDEKDLLELASTFFEDESVELDTTWDFNEALRLLKENDYSVVISDVNMPTGSGIDIFRFLEENNFKGKRILVSGDKDKNPDEIRKLYDVAICKPIDFLALIDQVKEFLAL